MSFQPIVIAHRGASGLAPENTLAAFKKALEIGVDRIEMDLRQTADGQIVVIHDKTISRTTNGLGSVRKINYKSLQKYSAGSWFHSDFNEEKVPLLTEVLELINGRTTLLLEIKNGTPYHNHIEKNIIQIVNEHKANDWCIVQSFNDKVLDNFHKVPSLQSDVQKLFAAIIPVAPFYGGSQFSYKRLKSYGFAQEININYKYVNPRVVKKIHEMGKKVNVWTVNEYGNLQKFVEMGVDGIITDYPNRLKEILKTSP